MNDLRYRARGTRTLAVVDANSIYAAGLRTVLSSADLSAISTIWVDLDDTDALDRMVLRTGFPPDLILIDEGLLPVATLKKYVRRWPDTHWVVLVACPRRSMESSAQYLSAGARALLPRAIAPDRLQAIVQGVLSGQPLSVPNQLPPIPTPAEQVRGVLTSREMEILQLIAQGLRNHEIGKELFISDQTVGVHRKNLMRKLAVNNSAALVGKSFRLRLIY
jgi:DNA-binding NarL/FixJ family response regulator